MKYQGRTLRASMPIGLEEMPSSSTQYIYQKNGRTQPADSPVDFYSQRISFDSDIPKSVVSHAKGLLCVSREVSECLTTAPSLLSSTVEATFIPKETHKTRDVAAVMSTFGVNESSSRQERCELPRLQASRQDLICDIIWREMGESEPAGCTSAAEPPESS